MLDLEYTALLEAFAEHRALRRSESAAFLIWYLENYYRLDKQEATDAVCDQGGDRGVDGLFVNDNDQTITVFQSKIAQASNKTIGDASLRSLSGCLTQFRTPADIQELLDSGGEAQLCGIIRRADVLEKIATYEVRGEWLSNLEIDANGTSFLASNPNILFVGKSYLQAHYISPKRSESITTPVSLSVAGFNVTEYIVDAETRAIIAPISARELVELEGINDQSLFDYNVRGPLGRTQVNRDIVKSIKDRSKHKSFPLFHNGITIIAGEIEKTEEAVTINNYHVVNGCQSLTTLHANRSFLSDDLRILTKFIQLPPASNSAKEITEYSNNQNSVKGRDFKSNHPVQIRLQNEFKATYGDTFFYEIKTGEIWPKSLVKIGNEQAGLLLLAFDYEEPWATHRKYEVFEERHAELFGRMSASADKIVFLRTINDTIETQLPKMTNQLFARYVLTRYLFLYIVKRVFSGEAPHWLNRTGTMVRQPSNRLLFVEEMTALCGYIATELNFQTKSITNEGAPDIEFDYRGRLRDKKWVEEVALSILRMRAQDLERGRIETLDQLLTRRFGVVGA